MANKEISELTSKTTPVGTDEIEIQETSGGLSKKTTLRQIVSSVNSLVEIKASDTVRNNTNTITADPDLSIALAASTRYEVEIHVWWVWTLSAGDPDLKFEVNYSGTLSDSFLFVEYTNMSTAELSDNVLPIGTQVSENMSNGVQERLVLRGFVTTTTAGNLSVDWAQQVSEPDDLACKAGSFMKAKILS